MYVYSLYSVLSCLFVRKKKVRRSKAREGKVLFLSIYFFIYIHTYKQAENIQVLIKTISKNPWPFSVFVELRVPTLHPVLSCPVLSCPVLSCPILSYPILSYPILSYPNLS